MHRAKELKLLIALLKAKDKNPANPAKRFAANLVIWLLIGIAGGLAYNHFGKLGTTELIALCGTLIAGVAIGILSMCNVSKNQWPIIQPHINFESIEERARELET